MNEVTFRWYESYCDGSPESGEYILAMFAQEDYPIVCYYIDTEDTFKSLMTTHQYDFDDLIKYAYIDDLH